MKTIRSLAAAGAALLVSSSGAFAHGGHPVPAGVAPESHLHLAGSVVVPGSLLLGLALAGVAVGTVLWRRRSSARRAGAGRGRSRHHS